jgi:anaerobic selenocysteine-containing dehydrogenase
LAAGGDLGFETLDELHDEMGRLLAPRAPRARLIAGTGPAALQIPDGSLHLFTYPLLVDEGRLSERADELKAALGDEAFLEIHPTDAAARGVTDGGRATVRTTAGQAELPVRVTDHVAEGAVFVPFNQPGFAVNTILNGSFSIAADVEPVVAPAGELETAEAAAGGES